MRKTRVHIRLSAKTFEMLDRVAQAPGATKSAIVEDALRVYFDPDRRAASEAAVLRRLDAFDLRQGAIERDLAICLETLGQYVLYWLTRAEPVPDGERDATHALGRKRFDYFIEQVARKVGADRSLSVSVLAKVAPNSSDDHF